MHKRFTDQEQRAVIQAQDEARMRGRDHVGTEHPLLGLIDEAGVAAATLDSLGLILAAVRQQAAGQISGRRRRGRRAARCRSRPEPGRYWNCPCAKRCAAAITASAPSGGRLSPKQPDS